MVHTRRFVLPVVLLLAFFSLQARAQTCGDWSWANPQPQGNRLSGVAWGNGQFVAVGGGGAVMTSPDGDTWTPRITRMRADLWDVAWTGGQFVAVGDAGTVATSPDGLLWSPFFAGTPANLKRLAWSGSRLVAVGDGGLIVTSFGGRRGPPPTRASTCLCTTCCGPVSASSRWATAARS